MTHTLTLPAQTPASRWSQALQTKLMAALDAIWAILEHSCDPAEIKAARDRAKAIGDLAAMARKVAQIVPTPRVKAANTVASALDAALTPQAEPARRALDKLKGGGRARL